MLVAWLTSSASAWTHSGLAWEDGPIRYCVAADCPLEACEDAVHDAFETWLGALGCGAVWAEAVGPCSADEPGPDGVASLRFDALDEATYASFEPIVDGTVQVRGREYRRIVDYAVVIDRTLLDRRLLLEGVGHLLGMSHPCEDPSEDPALSEPPCGLETPPPSVMGGFVRGEPTEDDLAGLRALYDPWIAVDCHPAPGALGTILGVVPLDVRCDATGEVPTTLTWSFGEGAPATTGDHTYAQAGNYEIAVIGECDGGAGSFAGAGTVPVVALDEELAPWDATPADPGGGCGCAGEGAAPTAPALGLLVLVWRRRTRARSARA